jgi:hypothetical protein
MSLIDDIRCSLSELETMQPPSALDYLRKAMLAQLADDLAQLAGRARRASMPIPANSNRGDDYEQTTDSAAAPR